MARPAFIFRTTSVVALALCCVACARSGFTGPPGRDGTGVDRSQLDGGWRTDVVGTDVAVVDSAGHDAAMCDTTGLDTVLTDAVVPDVGGTGDRALADLAAPDSHGDAAGSGDVAGSGDAAGPASRLAFSEASPTLLVADTCSRLFTLQVVDANGRPTTSGAAIDVTLSATGAGATTFLADTDWYCTGAPITTLNLPANDSQASFKLRHDQIETITLRASALASGSFADATLDVAVSPMPVGVGSWRAGEAPGGGAVAAVWSGSELLAWRGSLYGGGRYDPALDRWRSMSRVNAPAGIGHAVWTGSKMLMWLDAGGALYDPVADSWSELPTLSAPTVAAGESSVVLANNEMLVWGGSTTASGGRYNLTTGTWAPISTLNGPSARTGHTAVWTGSQMIIWGGRDAASVQLNSGGLYNPSTDSWAATSVGANVPTERAQHSAIWTGSVMVIWGGTLNGMQGYVRSGGRYSPTTDTWQTVSTNGPNAPQARGLHGATWTGSEMIVWGGEVYSGNSHYDVDTGGRYDPVADSWANVTTTNVPAASEDHGAVWTGTELLVWGGEDYDFRDQLMASLRSGARFNPTSNQWQAMPPAGMPDPRTAFNTAWTGTDLIVWGGQVSQLFTNTGYKYRPASNSWSPISSASAPALRGGATSVWTGSELIVWSGCGQSIFGWSTCLFGTGSNGLVTTGGAYNPGTDSWSAISGTNVPVGRIRASAVWTGSEMLVWGGEGWINSTLGDGGAYHRANDTWSALSTVNAPTARSGHVAVWTGTEMIVWGGSGTGSSTGTGARYLRASDSWQPMSDVNAPVPRNNAIGVWTGTRMLVWGGSDGTGALLANGASYDPALDRWTAIADVTVPLSAITTGVWTGNELIVWGPSNGTTPGLGGIYVPGGNSWTSLATANAPNFGGESAVWTGTQLLVYGPDQTFGVYTR